MHGKGSGNIRGEGGGRESVHPVSCVPLAEHFIKVTFSTHSPQFVQPETNPLTRAGGVCRHGKGSGSVEAEGWGSWGWRVGRGVSCLVRARHMPGIVTLIQLPLFNTLPPAADCNS
jgi:hypothetical protein